MSHQLSNTHIPNTATSTTRKALFAWICPIWWIIAVIRFRFECDKTSLEEVLEGVGWAARGKDSVELLDGLAEGALRGGVFVGWKEELSVESVQEVGAESEEVMLS